MTHKEALELAKEVEKAYFKHNYPLDELITIAKEMFSIDSARI